MNYGTIKARVKLFLDYGGIDTEIGYWINDYRQTLAVMPDVRWPHLWTDSTASIVAGSSTYALPSDYIDHDFIMLGGKKLSGMSDRDFALQYLDDEDGVLTADEPRWYVIKGRQIKLYPQPDKSYTLRLYYYSMPSNLSSASDSDHWTTFYPNLIIHGAVVLGSLFLDDQEKLKTHQALLERELAVAVRTEKDKHKSDIPPVMKTYKDYTLTAFRDRFRAREN